MEKWQKDYIRDHLPTLINHVECNISLLSNLCKYGVLSDDDTSTLTATGRLDGEVAKSHQLLKILFTRQNGYEHLAKSLYNCRQTGALLTLLSGVEKNIPHQNAFHYCGLELNPTEFLGKTVIFQGQTFQLSQVCRPLDPVCFQKLIKEYMDVLSYKQFLSEECITLSLETVPKPIPFYIPRSLTMKTEVEASVFESLNPDVFLIEGVDMHQLSLLTKHKTSDNLVGSLRVDKSSNQMMELTAQLILLENSHHFNKIADQSVHYVHWLKYSKGKYHYVRSNGGEATSRIRKHLRNTNIDAVICQEEFIQMLVNHPHNNCPVIIYDSPGMGKSVLLAELARTIKDQQPEKTVVFVQFTEIINCLTASGSHFHSAALKRSLLEIISANINRLGQKIMKELFENPNHQIEIFLDGFDELHEEYVPSAVEMLKSVSAECKNTRVFVASRPHRADILEGVLGVLGYNILPFSEEDQVSFFTKFWKSHYGIVPTDQVKSFARRCLKSFNNHVSSDEKEIAGIPLQCRMLAEIYAESAKMEDTTTIDSDYRINSVYKMYKEYVHGKVAAVCIAQQERTLVYEYLAKLALQLLFSENVSSMGETVHLQKMYAIGILEPSHSDMNTPNFVHRTFAEYIAAEYLVTQSTEEPELKVYEISFLELFLNKALASRENKNSEDNELFIHKGVVRFFSFSLADRFPKLRSNEVFRVTLRKSKFFDPIFLFNLIKPCLYGNVKHMVIFILNLYLELDYDKIDCKLSVNGFKPEGEQTIILNYYSSFLSQLRDLDQLKQLIGIAAEYSSFELVKLSYTFLSSLFENNLNEIDFQDALERSVRRGNYQIFDYLFSLSSLCVEKQSWLLYKCLYFSRINNPEVVAENVQIVKLILSESPTLVDLYKHNCDANEDTPIFTYRVHFELMKCLIEAGADLAKTTRHTKANICHLAAVEFPATDFHKLVELLIAKNLQNLLISKNANFETPIHIALNYIELHSATLELFSKRLQINFSDASAKYGSELAYAIRGRRSRRVLEDIVRLEGNWKSIGFNQNVISLAIEHYNVEALEYFISLGANPNKRRNVYVEMPLSIALTQPNGYEMVKILVENGADVNALSQFIIDDDDSDDQNACSDLSNFRCISPLQYAREYKHEYISILEEHGADDCKLKSCCMASCLYLFCFPCLACHLWRNA